MTQVRLSNDQAYEYASNEVSLVTFLLEIVPVDPKTLKNPKNERKPHFNVRVFNERGGPDKLLILILMLSL